MSLTMLAGQLLALRAQLDAALAHVEELVEAETTRRERLREAEELARQPEEPQPLKMPPTFGASIRTTLPPVLPTRAIEVDHGRQPHADTDPRTRSGVHAIR